MSEKLSLSGTITNNGDLNSTNTKIQLISYDSFEPPRVLGISSVDLENDIMTGESDNFQFDVLRDSRASIFKIVGESQDYSTGIFEISDTSLQILNKLVTISDITVTDIDGNRLSDVSVGTSVNIQSNLDFQELSLEDSGIQEYVYWIQIKKSVEIKSETKSFVEFIGKAQGTIDLETVAIPSVGWIPENDGLYFVETFVWDPNYYPLASKGPLSLILVN